MRLIVSSRYPSDSLYSTEAGQVLYEVDKLGFNFTSLSKVQDNGDSVLYAQLEFHTLRSTRFRFNNKNVSVDEFFRKEGWLKPKRVFRAADGREYYWKLDGRHLEMFRKGESDQQVVEFQERKRSFGASITDKSASLEVDNSCLPILDEIIMTLEYCQKKQQDKQWFNGTSDAGFAGIAAGTSANAVGASGAGAACASGGF